MTAVTQAHDSSASASERWYALDAAGVAAKLGVDPPTGLSAARAADLLARNGPNALPVEQPPSTLRRFLAQYTSYMQLILVGAAVVSLVIKEWTTAIVLIVIYALQRRGRAAPGGQGGERHERPAVDDEGDGAGAPRRRRGRDPRGAAGGRATWC